MAFHSGPHLSLLAASRLQVQPSPGGWKSPPPPPPPSCSKLSADPFVTAERGKGFLIQHYDHLDSGGAYNLVTHCFLFVCFFQLEIRTLGELCSSCGRQKVHKSLPYCSKEIWGPKSFAESLAGSEPLTHCLLYIGALSLKPPHRHPKVCPQKSLGNQLKGSVWSCMQRLESG